MTDIRAALPTAGNLLLPPVPILVIIPVHQHGRTLSACVAALRASRPVPGLDVIIVRDGAVLAQDDLGARQLVSPVVGSAAAARNRGAAELRRGILVFLDADVLVDEQSIWRLVEPILSGAADATVGNYSRDIRGSTFLQGYKQLHVATIYGRRAGCLKYEFWTAIGAVRAEVFHRLGGFDPAFRGACGEDTELGQRLTAAGLRVLAVPEATGRHLHPFTLWRLLQNDFRKGTQTMLHALRHRNHLSDNRHSTPSEMVAVLCAALLPLIALTGALLPAPAAVATLLLFTGAWLLGRRDQFRSHAHEGPLFLLRAIPLALLLDWVRGFCVFVALSRFAGERMFPSRSRQPKSIASCANTPGHRG